MRFRRKRRFDELVDRQLDLFATDDSELLPGAGDEWADEERRAHRARR